MQVSTVKNYFDRWSGRYERDLTQFGYAVPLMLSACLFGERILDIGIGTGLCAQAYKARVPAAKISGVDASRKMLDICKSKNITCDLHQMDVGTCPLPFDNGAFDGVMLGGVTEFLESPFFALSEAARVTRKGGRVAIAFEGPEGAHMYQRSWRRSHHVAILRVSLWPYPWAYRKYLHTPQMMQSLCEEAGLNFIDKQYFRAYRRSNGQEVGHWLQVFEKR